MHMLVRHLIVGGCGVRIGSCCTCG
jgi:hypothetical protein